MRDFDQRCRFNRANNMNFSASEKVHGFQMRLSAFMDARVYPNEAVIHQHIEAVANRWQVIPLIEELKALARSQRLWNLFLPDPTLGQGLTNIEYAPLCEIMGQSPFAPEIFNCSAPDTGNMEVLWRYGTVEQQQRWLQPLLAGEIRSGFAMTEPQVASSDATNIEASIVADGNEYVINARKWWTSGAGDPRCRVLIFMGKTNPEASSHRQQSMILVPMDTPGVRVLRPLTVFGYDDAPHGHMEIDFDNVRVPKDNILLGEGRGFEIAQSRLGAGRIHHCMRLIGVAERALSAMVRRSRGRVAFGKALAEQGVVMDQIARSRMEIEQARLLVFKTAWLIDAVGAEAARSEIASIKAVVPSMTQTVLDRAIQIHGAAGISADFGLAYAFAATRALRLADGPDDVHIRTVARCELRSNHGIGWDQNLAPPIATRNDPELIATRDDEYLDLDRLEPYLRRSLAAAGPMRIRQFGGGHANLTYLIAFDDAEYVLRRPPLGPVAPKAHDMQREHRVLSRLNPVFPLAPMSYLYCADDAIIGAPFQIMERRHGVVIRTRTPSPWQHPRLRQAVGEMLIDTLVDFHSVDRNAACLDDLGQAEHFVRRQLDGWAMRWQTAKSANNTAMDRLLAWLHRTLPDSDDVTLVHNDYKLDNLLVRADNPRVAAALLDWELCTSGDPLMDLGYLLNQWAQADDPPAWIDGATMPTTESGYPSRADALQRYAAATGRDLDRIDWYYAFSAMKFAVVMQQIFIRYRRGQTRDKRFADYDRCVAGYIDKGCAIAGLAVG